MLAGVMWTHLPWIILGIVGIWLLDIDSFGRLVGVALLSFSVGCLAHIFVRNWQDKGP